MPQKNEMKHATINERITDSPGDCRNPAMNFARASGECTMSRTNQSRAAVITRPSTNPIWAEPMSKFELLQTQSGQRLERSLLAICEPSLHQFYP